MNDIPENVAELIAQKALSLKVDAEAVRLHFEGIKEKYRRRITAVLEGAEQTILGHANRSDDEEVTEYDETRVEAAQRDLKFLGDTESALERMYATTEAGLAEVLPIITGRQLGSIRTEQIFSIVDSRENAKVALHKIIDAALWQAVELLEFDSYQAASDIVEAEMQVKKSLGF